jgi:RNA polymerase sigma-70 factor (ECF subfamily)
MMGSGASTLRSLLIIKLNMINPSDLDLVLRVRGGDRQAFTALIQRHQDRVYRICREMIGIHQVADEAAQETFVKAYLSLGDFRNDGNFLIWICRIAVNLALNASRKRQVMAYLRSSELLVRFLPKETSETVVPATGLQAARLSEKQLSVFVLRFFEGFSFEEISAILNTSVRNIEINYYHAVRKLTEHLTHAGQTGTGYTGGSGTHAEVAPLPD